MSRIPMSANIFSLVKSPFKNTWVILQPEHYFSECWLSHVAGVPQIRIKKLKILTKTYISFSNHEDRKNICTRPESKLNQFSLVDQ